MRVAAGKRKRLASVRQQGMPKASAARRETSEASRSRVSFHQNAANPSIVMLIASSLRAANIPSLHSFIIVILRVISRLQAPQNVNLFEIVSHYSIMG